MPFPSAPTDFPKGTFFQLLTSPYDFSLSLESVSPEVVLFPKENTASLCRIPLSHLTTERRCIFAKWSTAAVGSSPIAFVEFGIVASDGLGFSFSSMAALPSPLTISNSVEKDGLVNESAVTFGTRFLTDAVMTTEEILAKARELLGV